MKRYNLPIMTDLHEVPEPASTPETPSDNTSSSKVEFVRELISWVFRVVPVGARRVYDAFYRILNR
jgi:hypothetical protein